MISRLQAHFLLGLFLMLPACMGPPEYGPEYAPRRAQAPSYRSPLKPHPSSPWADPADDAAWLHELGEDRPVAHNRPAATRRTATLMEGNLTTMPSGNEVYRDRSSGRIIGSASTSPAGNTTYRDADGRISGSSAESPSGRTTHRDGSGRISITSDTTPGSNGDSTTYYRKNGVIVGQKYLSPAGNTTWRDGNGRIVSGPTW